MNTKESYPVQRNQTLPRWNTNDQPIITLMDALVSDHRRSQQDLADRHSDSSRRSTPIFMNPSLASDEMSLRRRSSSRSVTNRARLLEVLEVACQICDETLEDQMENESNFENMRE